jgi:hypothetical protein
MVKIDSGVLSWQTAGYVEIIALNALASSKRRMSASGKPQSDTILAAVRRLAAKSS